MIAPATLSANIRDVLDRATQERNLQLRARFIREHIIVSYRDDMDVPDEKFLVLIRRLAEGAGDPVSEHDPARAARPLTPDDLRARMLHAVELSRAPANWLTRTPRLVAFLDGLADDLDRHGIAPPATAGRRPGRVASS